MFGCLCVYGSRFAGPGSSEPPQRPGFSMRLCVVCKCLAIKQGTVWFESVCLSSRALYKCQWKLTAAVLRV